MLTLTVGEIEYNCILHDLLRVAAVIKTMGNDTNQDLVKEALRLVAATRGRLLLIIENTD